MKNYLILLLTVLSFLTKAQDLVSVKSIQIINNIHNYNLECFRVQFVMDSTFQNYIKRYKENATIVVRAFPKYNKKNNKYTNFVNDTYLKYYNEITNSAYIRNNNSDTINIDIPYHYFYLYANNTYKVKFDLKIEITEYHNEKKTATNNYPTTKVSILEVDNLNSPTVMLQIPQLYQVALTVKEYQVKNGKWDVKVFGNGNYDPDPYFKIIHGNNEIYQSSMFNNTYYVQSNEVKYFYAHLKDEVSLKFLDFDKLTFSDHIATINLDLSNLLKSNNSENQLIDIDSLSKLNYNLKIEPCNTKN